MVEAIKLINTTTRDSIDIDRDTTPDYVLESVDWGTIEGTHHTYKFVNQIGDSVENVTLGTRDVEIIGWVIGETEQDMNFRKRKLNMFVNPQQMLELYYNDYLLTFYPESSIKYSKTTKENNEFMTKFKIDGKAHDPLFGNKTPSVVEAVTTRGLFHFPLIINTRDQDPPQIVFGLREPSAFINIPNEGQVKVGMKIVFVARGALTNPSITNAVTYQYFKINKSLAPGERIEIDTSIGKKKITGIINHQELNYYKYRDLNSSWLQLEIGDNIFTYDADSNRGNLDIYIYYDNKYLEVEECY